MAVNNLSGQLAATGMSSATATAAADMVPSSRAAKDASILGSAPVNSQRYQRALLRDQLAKFTKDPMQFGLSLAERQQLQAEQQQAGNAQRAAQQAQVARQALAGGEFQQGAFVEAQRQIAETAAQDASRASTFATQQSLAQIRRTADMLREKVAADIAQKQATKRWWLEQGVDLTKALGTMGASTAFEALGKGPEAGTGLKTQKSLDNAEDANDATGTAAQGRV